MKSQIPVIACLCGSTRYDRQFREWNRELTLRGEIVLAPGVYVHADSGHSGDAGLDAADKAALDELHRRKIDLADYVLIVSDETGYFGESTAGEIRYAAASGKPVFYAEPAARLAAEKKRLPGVRQGDAGEFPGLRTPGPGHPEAGR